jgi:hypothetical protein
MSVVSVVRIAHGGAATDRSGKERGSFDRSVAMAWRAATDELSMTGVVLGLLR